MNLQSAQPQRLLQTTPYNTAEYLEIQEQRLMVFGHQDLNNFATKQKQKKICIFLV